MRVDNVKICWIFQNCIVLIDSIIGWIHSNKVIWIWTVYEDWIDSTIFLCKEESIQNESKLHVLCESIWTISYDFWIELNIQNESKTLSSVCIDLNSQLRLLIRFKYKRIVLKRLEKTRNTHKPTKKAFLTKIQKILCKQIILLQDEKVF